MCRILIIAACFKYSVYVYTTCILSFWRQGQITYYGVRFFYVFFSCKIWYVLLFITAVYAHFINPVQYQPLELGNAKIVISFWL